MNNYTIQSKYSGSLKCVMYLFLLFSRTSFLSSHLSILPSSRLLWFLCCGLHITRCLGWFLRGRFPDGFVFPLPFLAFLPLILLFLGGTCWLKKKSGYTVIYWPALPLPVTVFQMEWWHCTVHRNVCVEFRLNSSSPRAAASSAPCPLHPGLCTSLWSSLTCSVVTTERKCTDQKSWLLIMIVILKEVVIRLKEKYIWSKWHFFFSYSQVYFQWPAPH